MDLAAVENRHRLIDQLHPFGAASKRDEGQPLVRERLALEVEVVELSRQLDGLCRLGGEGPDVGDRTTDETKLDPAALNALPLSANRVRPRENQPRAATWLFSPSK